jgi:ribonuclease PH
MIHWRDFIIGAVSIMIAYGVFTYDPEEEIEEEAEQDANVVINGRKYYQMSCQTCRKIKNFREVEPRIFECTKCHRTVNLKAS